MKIIIAIPDAANSSVALSGMVKILETANTFPGEHFDVRLARAGTRQPLKIGRFDIAVDYRLEEVTEADLIIIPAIEGGHRGVIDANRDLITWMSDLYRHRQTQLASVCTGAYLLAASGLLDGKEASSHWMAMDDLRELFPNVQWVPERVITDSEGIYTSGGAISSFNLILYLVEKFVSKDRARELSRMFAIDYPRQSQAPFMLFTNQKKHGDTRILEIQEYLEQHLAQTLTVDELARQFGMSRRNFIRRFKRATHHPPGTYLQRLRMEAAKREFERTNKNVGEVMQAVGYSDMTSFRQLFRQHSGYLPSRYRQKYGKPG